VEYRFDVVGFCSSGAGILIVKTNPVIAHRLVRCYDDLVTLTNVDIEDVGLVRNDRDVIH